MSCETIRKEGCGGRGGEGGVQKCLWYLFDKVCYGVGPLKLEFVRC